ncbi:arrestin domain-containing protein 2-like [Dendronephthya gigantea]|uniref:arrestin domain-containing protein 2-like n=1 Tax=Dendronephthya gigantea TaxID=151771 RepID=UPI00106D9FC7|nr:arrestin domain-containing protein 2-like [Dendronephthya gigantea]
MVRKLQDFYVEIDGNKEVFYSGEDVRGNVVVDVSQSMKCKQINVVLVGASYCHWTTTRTTTDNRGNSKTKTDLHTGRQLLVNLQGVLFGGSSTKAVQHPPGIHVYPFLFKLPSPLPSSFEGGIGHIRYYIEAKVDRPWKFDHKIRKPFTVNELIDINLPQYSTVPVGSKEKQIGCLCCVSGNLNMQASLDRAGYCPGEQIFLNALCENSSNREMRCMRATLVQNILYRAADGHTRGSSIAITRCQGDKIPARGQDSWNNQPFLIPPVAPTINTNPVSVSYHIKFDVRVPMGLNPKILLDITMGTVPFQRTFGRQCSYELAENQVMEAGYTHQVQPLATQFGPSSSTLGYPDMPPPSYAVAVGGLPVNVGDTEARSHFGDQSYVPRYTYAQPFQEQFPQTAPSGQFGSDIANLPPHFGAYPGTSSENWPSWSKAPH